jgi:hypothetical protein
MKMPVDDDSTATLGRVTSFSGGRGIEVCEGVSPLATSCARCTLDIASVQRVEARRADAESATDEMRVGVAAPNSSDAIATLS